MYENDIRDIHDSRELKESTYNELLDVIKEKYDVLSFMSNVIFGIAVVAFIAFVFFCIIQQRYRHYIIHNRSGRKSCYI